MKKGLICLIFLTVSQLVTRDGLCQRSKPIWARAGLRRKVEQLIVSKNKKYFLTAESTGGMLFRMWDAKSGFLLRTIEQISGPSIYGQNSVGMSVPIRSTSGSEFCYTKAWYHMEPYPNRSVLDSGNLYSFDFQDTMRLLFSRHVSGDAKFEYSKDLKDIIVYDSGTAKWLNAETGVVDYQINPYKLTDTTYSPDSSLKVFRTNSSDYNLHIQLKQVGIYKDIFSQDSIDGFYFSPNWKYVVISHLHFNLATTFYFRTYDVMEIDNSLNRIFSLNGDNMNTIDFSPDSKYIFAESAYRYSKVDTITVWNIEIRSIQTHLFIDSSQVASNLFFLGNDLYIGSIGSDPTHGVEYPNLRRWDLPSFNYLGRILGSERNYECTISGVLDISSASDKVLSTPDCGTVDLWDLSTGDSVIQFPSVSYALFTKTGDSILLVYPNEPIVRIWDVASRKIIKTISRAIEDSAMNPIISRDGKFFYYLDDYYKWPRLVVWNAESRTTIVDKPLDYQYGYNGKATAFSSDNRLMAIMGYYDSAVYIYDLRGGALISMFKLPYVYNVTSHNLLFSPDNSKLLIWWSTYYGGFTGGSSGLWNIEKAHWEWFGGKSAVDIIFSPDGKQLFFGGDQISYKPSDSLTTTDTTMTGPDFLGENNLTYNHLVISANGKYLACTIGSGNTFAIYSTPGFQNSTRNDLPSSSDKSISIFPNPSTGNISVKLGSGIMNPIEMNIYDLLGRKVRTEKLIGGNLSFDLNLGDLLSGSYFISVSSSVGLSTTKFVLVNK